MTASGSNRTPILIFVVITVLSAGVFFLFTLPALKKKQTDQPTSVETGTGSSNPDGAGNTATNPANPGNTADPGSGNTAPNPPPRLRDPAAVLEAIVQGLLAGDPDSLLRILGPEVVDPQQQQDLRKLFGPDGFEVDPANAVGEIGRTPILQRWAINLHKRNNPETKSRLELDFARQPDESWKPSRLRLPGQSTEQGVVANPDALSVALAFVEAVRRQDFPAARKYVDHSLVSDATIAGLCIIFEEGGFALRKEKPVVATVSKPNVAWFMAHIVSEQLMTESQFGLVLQSAPDQPWEIKQVNLDTILSVYAKRLGEGDTSYVPLVLNPQGGDSIVLYFAYDSDQITPRTMRQVEIIAAVIKSDPERKLKIWGHTDAKGTDDYNKHLSERRATAVREALVSFGLPGEQVTIEGFGASRPRKANFNPDGSDNPEGRRDNRRAEIYLDF